MKTCPKCGGKMYEDNDNYGDRLHDAYVCFSRTCEHVERVRLVACCDCQHCTFDPTDSIPYHCAPENMCMSRIEIPKQCKSYKQKESVRIDWGDNQ